MSLLAVKMLLLSEHCFKETVLPLFFESAELQGLR